MQTIADIMSKGVGEEPSAPPAGPEDAEVRTRDLARIQALGESLAKTRAEAISGRQTSGIETEWLEDEEFYEGIDAANRGEHRTNWRTKPPGQATPKQDESAGTTRSTVFPNITRPYVDAAAARIADMLLPTDDRSWAIKPTPVPDVVDTSNGKYSRGMLREAAAMHPGDPEGAKKSLAIATQAALEVIAEAKAKAEKAQTRIEDWHVECQWHAQIRQVIEDAARIGTGVVKGPVPMKKVRTVWSADTRSIAMVAEVKPGSKAISPWNLYPDPACGENIHNGSYIWEEDGITRKQLRELKGQDGYIDEMIDLVLNEGPLLVDHVYRPQPEAVADPMSKDKFRIWYFHGTAEREDLEAGGVDCRGIADPHIPAMIVMVNNRVIKAALNPLDTGEFPYDVMVWQRRAGFWAGRGVSRQIRTPQRIVVGATRNLMDNAGLAAGPMLVFRQGVVYAADGVDVIGPRKVFYIAEDAEEIADATKAIGVIKVDMLVAELLQIIQLGLKLAEDVTGLPMLLQGQMNTDTPETYSGQLLVNNNASAVLRRLARLFDDRVTEPHVRRYYTWLLLDPSVPDDEKGDYCVDARGSSALVERDLQNQAIGQLAGIVTNPVFGLDPKKWAQELLKSQRLDTKRFEFDDEQWKQIVANMAQGPADPRIAVAKLRADVDLKLTQLEQAFESSENDKDRALQAWLKEREQQGTKSISIDDIKAKLADTVIKTTTQKQLSREALVAREASKPPTEPAGRAKRGEAYQR